MVRRVSAGSCQLFFLLLVLFPLIPTAAAELGKVPPVMLSAGHAACCLVGVGDAMPTPSLPDADGKLRESPELAGEKGTVVVVWQHDNPMTRTLLADLRRDVQDRYGAAGVSVVGVAVGLDGTAARNQLVEAEATFPILIDRDGAAFAQIGKEMLPRVYVLDADGIIIWFDIEYSRATRRELAQTLRAMTQ